VQGLINLSRLLQVTDKIQQLLLKPFVMPAAVNSKKTLSESQATDLLAILRTRFEKNINRHKGLKWDEVEKKLKNNPAKLKSLHEMEETGGEPDVTGYDKKTTEITFTDCSAESPKGRRSICYDTEALESRKENKPKNSALGMAMEMGIEIISEEEYRRLQELESFDLKTSSWVLTPDDVRNLGGALFCDRRYNTVFVYHNGAESYYAGRAFRGSLRVK
jgi:Protein of unknown function (DUF4256)